MSVEEGVGGRRWACCNGSGVGRAAVLGIMLIMIIIIITIILDFRDVRETTRRHTDEGREM